MDIFVCIIYGEPLKLHGQVIGVQGIVNIILTGRYTLSAVLESFSQEMCPDAEDGKCSFTKQGLLQTALVIVYLAVSTEVIIIRAINKIFTRLPLYLDISVTDTLGNISLVSET